MAGPELIAAAALELTATADWYEGRRAGYGTRFLDEAQDLLEVIGQTPLVGAPWLLPGVPDGVRHVMLKTFPVAIVYVTEPRVVVVAIVGPQEPEYWIDRLDELG